MKGFCKILCVGIVTTMSVSAYAGTYNKEIRIGHTDQLYQSGSDDLVISGDIVTWSSFLVQPS